MGRRGAAVVLALVVVAGLLYLTAPRDPAYACVASLSEGPRPGLGLAPVALRQRSHLSPARERVARAARRHMGIPYRYGGTSHGGFDCSGFVQHVFRAAGFCLPRTSAEQVRVPATRYSVPWRRARVGDLVRWDSGHIGIYAGGRRARLVWESPRPGLRSRLRPVTRSGFDRQAHVHRVRFQRLRRC